MSKWSQYISSWFGPPLVYSDAELRRRLSPPVYEKTYTEKLREIFGFVYSDERLKHKWGRRTGEPERRDFSVKVDTPLKGDLFFIRAGTQVNVYVMAFGNKIREVNRLIQKYPLPNGQQTKAEDWKKVKGVTYATNGKTVKKIEEVIQKV